MIGRILSLPRAALDLAGSAAAAVTQAQPWPGPLSGPPHDFYVPPAGLTAGTAPGTLLDQRPMGAYLLPGLKLRGRAYRILYASRTALGDPVAVSGALLLPTRARHGKPVVGYAPGTHGLGDHAAPSRLLGLGLDYETMLIAMMLAKGLTVAVTDYEGLGTPGEHPYLVGRALGRNVLDVVRAARQVVQAELPEDGPLGLLGYSEGGSAAAWAAEMHPDYAPELDLAGVVAGSVPADLQDHVDHVEGHFYSFFAGMGAIGFDAAYPELDLESALTERGRREIAKLRGSSIVGAFVFGPHFTKTEDVFTHRIQDTPAWRNRIRENSAGQSAPIAPVLLHTAWVDHLVPPRLTQELAERWQARGADVELRVNPGFDHLTGAITGTPPAIEWLTERLDAAAAPRPARRPTLRRLRAA